MRQLTLNDDARKHLDALVPLVAAKLAEMAQVIELRRRLEVTALLAFIGTGQGRQLMDSIRAETNSYIRIEEVLLRQVGVDFQASMRQLFALIVISSVATFLLALAFAYLIYRETQHRLDNLLHSETQRLLGIQEEMNKQLEWANLSLHVTEERLAVTLNSIGDAVIATDAEGRVTLLNPLAERLTGWSQAEAVNRQADDILRIVNAETRLPSANPVTATLAKNTIQRLTNPTLLIARDGSECDIADSCAPIHDRDGQLVGAVLVFRDVTERKRLDQTLLERNAELESAKSAAEKANLAKSEFLSSMSHELRTPLSAILGFAQIIESGASPLTASQKRGIEQILKAGWYLLALINEILDLALIESGKLPLSLEPVSLSDIMRECHDMIEPQAQTRGISVEFPKFDRRYFVHADRTRVKQVLINLLSNALKYNKAGGTVVVDCSVATPGRMRLCVEDSGEGLSPDQLANLFQPFNRLGQETKAEEGTGIGLVMSKRLVEMMDGVIGVESTVGKGSVFWIELNLTAERKYIATAADPAEVSPMEVQAGAQLRTLLYVEDNPANLMLVEELIARRSDIRLLSAADGNVGVAMARASRPDVILMDINLPGISGLRALEILRSDATTAHIPIIALSANAMSRDIEKGLAAGFFRYLTKPINVNEFLSTLDVALKFADTHSTLTDEGVIT
jgi:PAS domain S-box-containing protein